MAVLRRWGVDQRGGGGERVDGWPHGHLGVDSSVRGRLAQANCGAADWRSARRYATGAPLTHGGDDQPDADPEDDHRREALQPRIDLFGGEAAPAA